MTELTEGRLDIEGSKVVLQKSGDDLLFCLATDTVTTVVGGMALTKRHGWLFIDSWKHIWT